MKPLQILACSVALVILSPLHAAPANAPLSDLQTLLTEGQAAYLKGDMATAKADLELVLQLDPHNKTATGYLRNIAVQEKTQNKGAILEKQLDALMIPKLDFKEASLSSSLDFMKKQAEKLSSGKIAVNFAVFGLTQEQQNTLPVTLNLSNIPFTEALRYIGGVAGVTFTYERYAIRVTPSSNAAAAAATTTAPGGAAPLK